VPNEPDSPTLQSSDRHCEEQSDEAIHPAASRLPWIASPSARIDGQSLEDLRREGGGHGLGLGGGGIEVARERFEALDIFGEGGLEGEGRK